METLAEEGDLGLAADLLVTLDAAFIKASEALKLA